MKRCIKWLTAVLVILFSLTPVIAEEKMGDITIKYPVDNVTFKLFYLGEWKAELQVIIDFFSTLNTLHNFLFPFFIFFQIVKQNN